MSKKSKQSISNSSSSNQHISKREREKLEDSSIRDEKAVRDEESTETNDEPQFHLQWLLFRLILLHHGHCKFATEIDQITRESVEEIRSGS